jgi:hypothetical protein
MKNYQTVKRIVALASVTGTATAAGEVIDCKGADYATIELLLSDQVNTNAAPVVVKIQESDDTNATAFTDISTTNLQKSIDLTDADQVAAFHVNVGNGTRKRYLRLFATPGTHTTNSVVTLAGIANLEMDVRPSGTTGQADVVAIG